MRLDHTTTGTASGHIVKLTPTGLGGGVGSALGEWSARNPPRSGTASCKDPTSTARSVFSESVNLTRQRAIGESCRDIRFVFAQGP